MTRSKSVANKAPSEVDPAPAKVDPTLNASDRKLLAEALRRGEETRDVMEDALVSFGRWLLVNVFNDDAAAALDDRARNPVWLELLHHAGGPKLRIGRKLLFVAVHIAARDKRITDEAWRNLEPGRKQLLLPLGDEARMRQAAQHVTAMKLTLRATETYVAALRAEAGAAPRTRVTPQRLTARIKRFREGFAKPNQQAQLARALRSAGADERKAAHDELRALRDWANALLRQR